MNGRSPERGPSYGSTPSRSFSHSAASSEGGSPSPSKPSVGGGEGHGFDASDDLSPSILFLPCPCCDQRCCSTRSARNALYINASGWTSAAGGWISGYCASSVWGIILGGLVSAVGNLLSTVLVWERHWDSIVHHRATVELPALMQEVSAMRRAVHRAEQSAAAAATAAAAAATTPEAQPDERATTFAVSAKTTRTPAGTPRQRPPLSPLRVHSIPVASVAAASPRGPHGSAAETPRVSPYRHAHTQSSPFRSPRARLTPAASAGAGSRRPSGQFAVAVIPFAIAPLPPQPQQPEEGEEPLTQGEIV